MSEALNPTDWKGAAMRNRIARRYASERRFRAIGLFAVLLSASFLAFLLITMMANGLRGWMLKDGTRDTGCGLKAFRRDAFLGLPFFNHMHRYLPALFARDGWAVVHVDVSHRSRGGGRSNYSNLQRALVGSVDLFGVAWLIRRKKQATPHAVPRPDDQGP